MIAFSRADNSLLARWWWTVDRWMLLLVLVLMTLGYLVNLSASPAVAEKLGLDLLFFAKKQAIFLLLSMAAMFALSMMPVVFIRRLALMGFVVTLALVLLTLLIGPEYKGATRWLPFGLFTLQPSEFLKPFFIVTVAWILSAGFEEDGLPARSLCVLLFVIVAGLLMLQPDVGQTVLVAIVFIGQLALAGLPLMWIAVAGASGLTLISIAYLMLPHVSARIDSFLDPASGDTYQTDKAIQSFESGGVLGTGPGEGVVKHSLPDAHTDYIFAVVGEEFGIIACVLVLLLFAAIVARGMTQSFEEQSPFKLMAVSGLLMQFGMQVMINVGVNLAVLPPKGMTLPFISYGGSSMMALGVSMGMLLALSRCNRFAREIGLGLNDRSFV